MEFILNIGVYCIRGILLFCCNHSDGNIFGIAYATPLCINCLTKYNAG